MRSLHKPLDQRGRSRISAVDEHRPDQRLADVGEDGGAAAPAGIGLRRAEPDRRPEIDRPRDVGACLLAHEVGEAARHFPFVGLGKGTKQHVRHDEAEHMIAEKFEALVGAGAIAGAGQRGNVRERLIEQRGVLEAIADALFESGGVLRRRRLVAFAAAGRARSVTGRTGGGCLPAAGLGASMEARFAFVRLRLIVRS